MSLPIRNILPEESSKMVRVTAGIDSWAIDFNRLKAPAQSTNPIALLQQAIHIILNTEPNTSPIYSYNFGLKTTDLIGKQPSYVIPILKKRIKQALLVDDRINDVVQFEFDYVGDGALLCKFTVISIYGNVYSEVSLNV